MKTLFNKLFLFGTFILRFLWAILLANIRVAYEVVTPRYHARPGIIFIPLDCKKDIEITLLAIVISLTPGTLALDVSSDKRKLYIHAMFLIDKEKLIREIKYNFEQPIKRMLA